MNNQGDTMRQITAYEAIDGEVFDTIQECNDHEKQLMVISLIKKHYSNDEPVALDVADFINNHWAKLCEIKHTEAKVQNPTAAEPIDKKYGDLSPYTLCDTKDIGRASFLAQEHAELQDITGCFYCTESFNKLHNLEFHRQLSKIQKSKLKQKLDAARIFFD